MAESQASQAPMSPQERTARDYLAQGKFRKARDEFKLLCKSDRAKFLPLLIEANAGLARAMIHQGLVDEARQVISYLKTIAPPEAVLALELEVQRGSRSTKQGPTSQNLLEAIAKTASESGERQRLADAAVLIFEPVLNVQPEIAPLALELEAIGSALRAISERQFDLALDLVRPLGQLSPFNYWKIFIKGLAAFHSGEKEKAVRFFGGLPLTSVPGQASRGYLLLLGVGLDASDTLPSPAAIEGACRLVGEPDCGTALHRAEQDWRKGRAAEMYLTLRNEIRRFPSEGTDLVGVLSEFAIHCFHGLPDNAKDSYIQKVAVNFGKGGRAKSPGEEYLLLRLTLLETASFSPDALAVQSLERYLRLRDKLHGPDPRFDSTAYGWMGKMLSDPPGPTSSIFGIFEISRSSMRNPEEARRLLEKALQLDDNNLPVCLKLCEVYEKQRLISERNRLLDVMAVKFAQDKNVLLLVAEACLERKAPRKGLDYLMRAQAVDRLDPNIPDLLAKAWLLQAREQFQKKKPELARKSFNEAAHLALPAPENLSRSAWCMKIQRGLMESIWGDQTAGSALLDEARRESPSAAAFLFYAGFAVGPIGRTDKKFKIDFFKEFDRLIKREANVADATLVTRIWSHGKSMIEDRMVRKVRLLLKDYLLGAAKMPFSREKAIPLIEFCLKEEDFEAVAREFVKQYLQKDDRDPAFRLYKLDIDHWLSGPREDSGRAELESIVAEATLRKDDQSIRKARQKLDAIRSAPPPPESFEPEGGPSDDDDDDNEFDPMLEFIIENLPEEQQEFMRDLVFVVKGASDREILELKRTRPPGMSPQDFDMMVDLLRGKFESIAPDFGPEIPVPKAAPKRPPLPKPSRSPRLSDPNQPELF